VYQLVFIPIKLFIHSNCSFYYVTLVEDRPILSAHYCFPLFTKTDSSCSAVSLR